MSTPNGPRHPEDLNNSVNRDGGYQNENHQSSDDWDFRGALNQPDGQSQAQYGNQPQAQYGDQHQAPYGNQTGNSDYDPYRYVQPGEQPGANPNSGYSNYQQNYQAGFQQQYAQQYSAPHSMSMSTEPQPGYPTHGIAMKGGEEPPLFPVRNGPEKVDLGDALMFGARRLNKTFLPWLGIMALYAGIVIAVMIAVFAWVFATMDMAANGSTTADDVSFVGRGFLALILLATLFLLAIQVFFTRGAFEIADGRKLSFGSFFKVSRWGNVIGIYIVTGILMSIAMLPGAATVIGCSAGLAEASPDSEGVWVAGVFLGILLMVVASVFIQPITVVMPLLVFDGEASVLEAPAKAWQVVKPQYWRVLLFLVVASLINSVASSTYIAFLYTVPMVLIAQVYVYRMLIGGRRLVNVPQNPDF